MRREKGSHQGWQVYVLCCADGTLYTGIARNAAVRLLEHNGQRPRGARYTRARRPVRLVYVEDAPDRATATRREHAIKALPRTGKLALLAGRVNAGDVRKSCARRRRP